MQQEKINFLKSRLLELSFKNDLAHLSSTLSAIPIIYDIYLNKKEEDIFILSAGHAGLALYVVLEYFYEHIDAQDLYEKHGVHPCYDRVNKISCSTGSLGQGITVAVGYAFAHPDKKVHVYLTDGESFEGCVWEALEIIYKYKLYNIILHFNINGYSATENVDKEYLIQRLKAFLPENENLKIIQSPEITINEQGGIKIHYTKMNNEDYEYEKNLL